MAMPGSVSSSVVPGGLSLMPTSDMSLPRAILFLAQGGHYLSVSKAPFRWWVGELNASGSGSQMVPIQASGASLLA